MKLGNGEVELTHPKRRRFSAGYKLKILAEVDMTTARMPTSSSRSAQPFREFPNNPINSQKPSKLLPKGFLEVRRLRILLKSGLSSTTTIHAILCHS